MEPHRLHDQRHMPMAGGMIRLSADHLQRAPLDGLVRLAAWLGLEGRAPYPTEAAYRLALVAAIMRAEAKLARGPKARRHDRIVI